MVVVLGQQCNVGEKPTVILFTAYINRHTGTPEQRQKHTEGLDITQSCCSSRLVELLHLQGS